MKYMRKTPVEAIQWNGHNLNEVSEFISHATKSYSMWSDGFDNLDITYSFQKGRTSRAVIPLFGWVVKDGKSFEFYKDATFRKTFEEARGNDSKGVDWEGIIKTIKDVRTIRDDFEDFDEMLKGCKGVFMAEPSKETLDLNRMRAQIDPNGRLTKLIDDLYKDDKKTRKEIKKNLSEGLKDMAGSDTHKATFESVLDEMKELHAKKNKDYGDAAHVNFLKYGPVASLSRLSEKMQRAEHILLSGKCEVKDEPLTETLIDIAITSAMLYMELKNKGND